jgi:membrane-associated phospholipid phosphatase
MWFSALASVRRTALIACLFAVCWGQAAAAEPPADSAAPANPEARAVQQRYQFQPGVLCPFCAITPQYPHAESGLHWHHHWKTVGVPEYAITGVLGATALGVELLIKPEGAADWNTPILFDSAVRDALRIGSASGRETAKDLSDVLFFVSIAHPLVDDLVFAWWLRESPQVAWQMFVINAQAYAFTLAANVVTKRLTGRARPWAEDCDERPLDARCASGEGYRSFYSGHAAVTATGAGLICAHHTQLSLYRNDYLDTGACITAVLGTALTGALRIASDNHWASDVVIGHLMGYFAGYLYPTLMYYREFRLVPEGPGEHAPPRPAPPTFTFLPVLSPTAVQLSMLGMF